MNKSLNEIIKLHKKNNQTVSIGIVWSFNFNKNFNDIDMLILHNWNKGSFLKEIKKKYWDYKIIDDSLRLKIDNTEFWLVYKNYRSFLNTILKIINWKNINRVNKEWAIWGYLPEIILNDLHNMSIIYDNNLKISKLKNNLKDYPINFKNNLLRSLKSEILIKYDFYIKSKWFNKNLAFYDINIAIIRYLYCINNIFFSWIKHMDENIFNNKDREIIKHIKNGSELTKYINFIL